MNKIPSRQAAVASLIRKELRARGINAKVTSRSFAGGDDVNVKIFQDLTPTAFADVKKFCESFEEGRFDGMNDIYEYYSDRGNSPSVEYVIIEMHYSDELKKEAEGYVDHIDGIPEYERSHYVWMVLNGTWGDFWKNR